MMRDPDGPAILWFAVPFALLIVAMLMYAQGG